MKHRFLLLLAACSCMSAIAQRVGIGTTSPKASAQLDVQSTTRGVTLPSMTSAQRRAIANPAKGLLVFDLEKACFFFFDGANWKAIGGTNGQAVAPVYKGEPGNLSLPDAFGSSLSMDKGYAVVGAPGKDTNAVTGAGAAYIYRKSIDSGWNLVQLISPADLSTGAHFGASVCIDSNYISIAAPYKTEGGAAGAGRVYIYRLNGSSWVLETSITQPVSSQVDAAFGYSTSISSSSAGVSMIVGCPLYDYSGLVDAGAVHLYNRGSGGVWTATTFYGNQEQMALGSSVAIEGSHAIAGAPSFDTTVAATLYNDIGKVVCFSNTSGWVSSQEITAGTVNSLSGYRVAFKDSLVAIAGWNSYGNNNQSDLVHVFHLGGSGTLLLDYSFIPKTFLPEHNNENCVGFSLAINKNYLLLGLPQQLATSSGFTCSSSNLPMALLLKKLGTAYELEQKIIPQANAGSLVGQSVGLDGYDFGIFGTAGNYSDKRGILFGVAGE